MDDDDDDGSDDDDDYDDDEDDDGWMVCVLVTNWNNEKFLTLHLWINKISFF